MIRRIAAISIAMTFVGFSAVADDVGGEDIVVPPPAAPVEEPVTLAPPEYIRSGVARSARSPISIEAKRGSALTASDKAYR